MFLTGHIATAYVLSRGINQTRQMTKFWRSVVLPCVIGVLLPDLIDKPLRLMAWTPHGRSVGHSVLTWFLVCCVCALWQRRRWPGTWAVTLVTLGWGLHLMGDLFEESVLGVVWHTQVLTTWWLWPWATADTLMWPIRPWQPDALWGRFMVDSVMFGFGLGLVVVDALRRRRA